MEILDDKHDEEQRGRGFSKSLLHTSQQVLKQVAERKGCARAKTREGTVKGAFLRLRC